MSRDFSCAIISGDGAGAVASLCAAVGVSTCSSDNAHTPALGTADAGVWRTPATPVALYDEVIRASADHDLAGILELPDHGHDRRLRRFDVALSGRAKHFHFFLERG